MRPIYLDHHATTPLDPKVLEAMQPYWMTDFGNPASPHAYGWAAENAVKKAREKIVRLLAPCIGADVCAEESLTFTSGTTESNNMVLKGVFLARHPQPIHIITQATEHDSILNTCKYLQKLGCDVTYLKVDAQGLIHPDTLRAAMKSNTHLVSIMYANHEVGTIQHIQELADIVHRQDHTLFHVDAAQAVGKIALDVVADKIDLLSCSAHKIYGPKGIGLLYRSAVVIKSDMVPLLHGGNQEQGLRSGTLNVPGIVGFAKALEICLEDLKKEMQRQSRLRDHMIKRLTHLLDHVIINGHPTQRLPGNVNLLFQHVDAGQLMLALPRLAVSSGSACASGSTAPSSVLLALGRSAEDAKSSLRIGLGRGTRDLDVEEAIDAIVLAVQKLRKKSLSYQMATEK